MIMVKYQMLDRHQLKVCNVTQCDCSTPQKLTTDQVDDVLVTCFNAKISSNWCYDRHH